MRNRPRRVEDELRFALAGPVVTALLALVFGIVAAALAPSAPEALLAFVERRARPSRVRARGPGGRRRPRGPSARHRLPCRQRGRRRLDA
jgi:hypothetical protein